MGHTEINFGQPEGDVTANKYWLTRQLNGEYMLTKGKPILAEVGNSGAKDAYVTPGDPIGSRNLCKLILRVFGIEHLQRLESIEVELAGRVVSRG